jgi:hypothetical protein
MEGVWASSTTVLVSTQTQKVTFGNGGICFADGTCQTTAAVGSSTANYVSSSAPGVWVEVSSASVSAVASYTFSGISTTTAKWRIEYELVQNTSAGRWQIDFNGDSTAGRYRWGLFGAYSDLNTRSEALASAVSCYFNDDIATVGATYSGEGSVSFGTWMAGTMLVKNRTDHDQDASTLGWVNSTCHYNAVAPVTSARIFTSAGTFTGTLSLQRFIRR